MDACFNNSISANSLAFFPFSIRILLSTVYPLESTFHFVF
jgi:hypothetical protein